MEVLYQLSYSPEEKPKLPARPSDASPASISLDRDVSSVHEHSS